MGGVAILHTLFNANLVSIHEVAVKTVTANGLFASIFIGFCACGPTYYIRQWQTPKHQSSRLQQALLLGRRTAGVQTCTLHAQ
jgi:hypothetical protein